MYLQDDKSFNNHAFNDSGLAPLVASDLLDSHNAAAGNGVSIQYSIHCIDANPTIKPGSYVVSTNGLCPSLSHATTPIYSATISELNSITRGTIMCAQSPCLNLLPVSILTMTLHTSYPINQIPFAWMWLSQVIPLCIFLINFYHSLFASAMPTAQFSAQINTPLQQCVLRSFSTARLESNSLTKINGSRQTPMIPSCNLCLGLSSNQAQSATRPSRPLALITITVLPFNICVLF